MPPRARRQQPPKTRCTYREGGRRCTFDGTGDPPLCQPHRIAIAEAAKPRPPGAVLLETLSDFLQGKPINRETLGAVQTIADQWAGNIGADYRPDVVNGARENSVHQRAQASNPIRDYWWIHMGPRTGQGAPGRSPPPPPPPDPDEQKLRAALRVFGFTSQDVLTEQEITKRHRRLVLQHHPDRGGSTEKMAIINAARDVLLATLEV